MARNYRIQKRREKRNSFSTSMRISHSGRRVRASPPSPRRSGRRKLTNFPRYIGSSRDSSHRRERYSPRKETWADKTGSGATGCDRGNQRTHYIAVTEAEEGKLFDIYYSYKPSSASSSFLNTLYREMYVYFAAIDRSILEKNLPPRHREKKREIKYSITINGDRRRTSFQPVEKNASIRTESGNRSVAPCLRNTTTLPPPRRFKHSRGGAPVINETCL